MCGIAGTLGFDPDHAEALTRTINDAQRHRGPDHSVVTRAGAVTLGNTRLAIQDPTPAGNQPFVSLDGRYTCVFNGEIYNHRQLVRDYRLPVRTSCDGAVIPELWAKLGRESLAELRGMFAIALWDSLAERLYLARDPFGMKPLHWRMLPGGGFGFASEVRPLVAVAPGAAIDPAAIARYLHLGAMAADQSPYRDIAALPPNSVATVGRGSQVTVEPILPGGPLSPSKDAVGLASALVNSIELHLGADVPTALLLSSGVDSAAICAVSRRLGRELDCITVAAGGSIDEAGGAGRTASHYGHRFRRVDAVLAEGDTARFFAAMQRPTIDGLNGYLICKAIHEAGFKVALSGLGGDEVVGGYSHFRLLRFLPALRALDAVPVPVVWPAARLLAGLRGSGGTTKARRLLSAGGPRDGAGLVLLQREVLLARLSADLAGVHPDSLAGSAGTEDPAGPDDTASANWDSGPAGRRPGQGWPPGSFGAMAATEAASYLRPMLLADADTFSMAHSVELRLPFVDTGVFAASLAAWASARRPPGKVAIGTALEDPYLRDLATRPKRGFSLPMRSWLEGPLAPVLRAASEPTAPVWSVVDPAAAKRSGLLPLRPRDRWSEVWALAALNAWLDSVASGGRGSA